MVYYEGVFRGLARDKAGDVIHFTRHDGEEMAVVLSNPTPWPFGFRPELVEDGAPVAVTMRLSGAGPIVVRLTLGPLTLYPSMEAA